MDLKLVRKINGLVGSHFGFDFFMDFIARFGHLFFVLYGLWLWFGGSGEDRERRRACALSALSGVVLCSVISFVIGKIWNRPRPFVRDGRIWNFTGHKANASFPSNHTMNSAVITLSLFHDRMPFRWGMAALSALLAFSRVFAGIHYVTDLLGGFAIAAAVHSGIARFGALGRVFQSLAAESLLLDGAARFLRKGR